MKVIVTLLAAALFSTACTVHAPPIVMPLVVPVAPPHAFDLVGCSDPVVDNYCDGPADALFTITPIGLSDSPRVQQGSAGGYVFVAGIPATWTMVAVTITAPGFVPFIGQASMPELLAANASGLHNTFHLTSLVPPLPQPVARSPLVLEPNDPTGLICPQQQIVTVPSGPDRRFWRGDAWGVTVPGLPFVAGGSSRHPERALSWFLDRWPLEVQQDILNANRARGYTHFTLSWPDSRDGAGQSAEEFAQTAVRVNAVIPFVHVMLTSKDFDPANADAATRMAAVSPAIDALIAHGFTGDNLILGVGWELDLFNEGQLLEDFIHALHAKYPQFHLYVHFTTYKTSWQPDGKPRAQFWQATAGELTGLLYQGNPSDACGLMAAHFNDAQVPASGLAAVGAVLVPWELVAAEEFDGDHPDEDDANARAWSVMQTPGAILAAGAGNGWRFPDGRPALAAYPVKP